jgi:hypothetical protein
LQAVARAQAAAGQVELAERAARNLSPPDSALRAVAEAQATAGQWDRAEQTAQEIAEPDHRVAALTAVADVDQARASALAADAQRVANRVTDAVELQQASGAVARALAAAGLWDDAEATAWEVFDPDVQREALGAVAGALVAVDRHRGIALADQMERDARAGMSTQPLDQAFRLGMLAKVLAGVDRDRAAALAGEAERAVDGAERYEGSDMLGVVAGALAAVEHWDRAERAANGIDDAHTRTEALGNLAGALVAAGEWDRAERVARAIPDLDTRVRSLAALAGALVAVDLDRALAVVAKAEDTARTIPPNDQAKARAVIIERLTAATTLDPVADDPLHLRVRRLLAEVLAGGRWLDALEPLAKLDPAALAAIDQELNA